MNENPLVGTWRLVSYQVRDENGNMTYPLGRDAVGFLTYTADGFMAGQLGRSNRAHVTNGDWEAASDADVMAAAQGYFAYCGTYEFLGDRVVHRVALSLLPNWIDGEQVRLVTMSEDILMLSTPPLPIAGRQQTPALVWKKA